MGDHWSDASGETHFQGVTGGVYRARRTIRTEAIFPDSLRLTALLPIVIAIVARRSVRGERVTQHDFGSHVKALRKAPAPNGEILAESTATCWHSSQVVALARNSAPRLTSVAISPEAHVSATQNEGFARYRT
ncbi:hypothetical protein IEQ34_025050 [Dendrobium chrysotoxum]|uniref:Uncharacterized protein n=1 Tax=Dendrobium chrysotoxum TaxID=161865 RepID=A0AAV7FQK0_DENCH|nr:hypothetical protein IEQ34_025050 [Dendrobium chrysotoxum]